MRMTEPVSTTGAAYGGAKILGTLGAAGAAGVIGAMAIAAVREPKSKREVFMRAAVAGTGSLFFGPLLVKLLDLFAIKHWDGWTGLSALPVLEALQYAAPVYLITGALSWGAFGALAALNDILKARGAAALAKRLGIDEDKTE